MVRDPDALVGAAAASGGSFGLYIQIATEVASTLVIWGNLLLVIGGLYFLCRRFIGRNKPNGGKR